ncbi:MAG: serine/threonine protein kinase [Sphingomonadaceae bacterium]|nr:serine/threonine protein kinase [Sphingomonadaceae bacterium]
MERMTGIGRYRIETAIGEGAMAMVWRAFDPAVGRRVAIKTLRPELARNADYVRRFLREARAAGTLSHPNIVTIFDVGEHAGQPYIAMELLEGRTLDQVLADRGRLPAVQVLRIAIQLADALAFAHAAGVVHRDIKPANVMLADADAGARVKMLDFGIARMTEVDGERTQIGEVLGSPRYMSPEQALGQPVDGRTDQFALGVLLYELITGRTAFSATTIASLALQIVRDPPESIVLHAPDCPPGLRRIVEKLLDKNPDRRFATGSDLGDALRREEAMLSRARPKRARRKVPMTFWLPAAATCAMACLLVPAGLWFAARDAGAMRRLAENSGRSMAAFVASNVALKTVENSALPHDGQDWLPVQSFVDAAVRGANVRHITLSDRDGLIRAADRMEFRGQQRSRAEDALIGGGDLQVSAPIVYAGRPFGAVDVAFNGAELDAAQADARRMLAGLIATILMATAGIAWAAAAVARRATRAKAPAAGQTSSPARVASPEPAGIEAVPREQAAA